MTPRDPHKEEWLAKLQGHHSTWRDGDLAGIDIPNKKKTPDLINDELGIAIELKEDSTFPGILRPTKPGEVVSSPTVDLSKLSSRCKNYVSDANHKLRNFPSYTNVLVIRSKYLPSFLEYMFGGIVQIRGDGQWRRRNRFFTHNSEAIDWYVFEFLGPRQCTKYAQNPFSEKTNPPCIDFNQLGLDNAVQLEAPDVKKLFGLP